MESTCGYFSSVSLGVEETWVPTKHIWESGSSSFKLYAKDASFSILGVEVPITISFGLLFLTCKQASPWAVLLATKSYKIHLIFCFSK